MLCCQENRCFYFRELQRLLQDQPPLGDNSEEVNIRETLLDLERYVTRYCRKQNIVLSPQRSQRTHLLSSHVLSKVSRTSCIKTVWVSGLSLKRARYRTTFPTGKKKEKNLNHCMPVSVKGLPLFDFESCIISWSRLKKQKNYIVTTCNNFFR